VDRFSGGIFYLHWRFALLSDIFGQGWFISHLAVFAADLKPEMCDPTGIYLSYGGTGSHEG
jgi:hypothetical protein